ncbi:hypothetical protein [Marinovum sp.]|uniref:hypothetical protein n=1 Tax=Marinovum sp. TaxID=2024839 RepID=UPI002B265157|nr:hypothetical protein [Marinovum sp.]
MARVTAASRVARRKIAPVPRDGCLRLDTGQLSAQAAAEEIRAHFDLPLRAA